jgi:uncharacterized protein involved in exopolysaccharide biosynthesis
MNHDSPYPQPHSQPLQTMSPSSAEEDSSDLMSQVDIVKVLDILRKSLLWVLVFITLGLVASSLYLRYTKPVYRSSSQLQIKNDFSRERRA